MVTNAMKHTLIISTTTCFVSGEGSRGGARGQRELALRKERKNDAPRRSLCEKMSGSARGLAIRGRRARTHRRDLEPRRVIGVIAEHGHVVPLSGFLRATATPGVSASHARCRVTIGTGEIRGNEVSGSIDRARVRGFGRSGSRVRARERSIQGTHRTRPRGGSRGSCWTSRSRSNAVINERGMRGPRGKGRRRSGRFREIAARCVWTCQKQVCKARNRGGKEASAANHERG